MTNVRVMNEMRESVARGATLLDKEQGNPEWDEKIDLETLDVSSSARCPAGQLYGEYRIAYQHLQIGSPGRGSGAYYGFAPGIGLGKQADWSYLTTCWCVLITDRIAARRAAACSDRNPDSIVGRCVGAAIPIPVATPSALSPVIPTDRELMLMAAMW